MQDDSAFWAEEPGEPGDASEDGASLDPASHDQTVRLMAVPRPETGELRVDAALSLLDELTELPVTEHPAVFERVHAQLGEVLDELGSRGRRDGS